MGENPSEHPSNDPGPPASSGAGGLDALISEAADLAAALAEDVGKPEEPAPAPGAHNVPGAESVPDADEVDQQLDRIEQSLTETQTELENATDENGDARNDETDQEPMDFMAAAAAFGTGDEPAAAPVEEGEHGGDRSQAPSSPGSDVSRKRPKGKVIQLGRPNAPQSTADGATTDVAPATGYDVSDDEIAAAMHDSACPSLDLEDGAPTGSRPSAGEGRATSKPSENMGLVRAVATICTALEVVDRPFAWVQMRVRRAIGWVAGAILFAALLIFVLTALR